MKATTVAFFAVLLGLTVACAARQLRPATTDSAPESATTSREFPTFLRALFAQGDFNVSCTFYEGELGLDIHTEEKDPVSGTWDLHNEQHSVSYDLLAVCARHGNQIYLLGTQRDLVVIEEWTFPEWDGGYASDLPKSGTAIGVPTAVTESSVYVAGPTYIPQASRGSKPHPEKAVVYQGAHFTGEQITWMRIDPEGRFGLVLTASEKLYQVPFDGSDTANLLFTPAEIPGLTGVTSIQGVQKVGVERQYIIYQVPIVGQPCTMLRDVDNDGVFESNDVTTVDTIDGLLDAGWYDLYTRY